MSPDRKSLATAASDQIRAIIEAAEQTAAQIRSEAEEEAARIRREAEEEASGIRSEARGDAQALLQSIREGMSRLSADLAELDDKLQPAPAPAPAAAPPPPPAPSPEAEPPAAAQTDAGTESARLVALNMALDGASRDEVDRYLRENFELGDPGALLDDVYASIGT